MKRGDTSIRLTSLNHRLNKAKIVIIGTVINVFTDRNRNTVMANVAVHMKLKGEKVKSIINIRGFGAYSSNNIISTEVSDCTDTNVNLYGTYLFTLKNAGNEQYSVHELDFQPAVTELKCQTNIQSRFKSWRRRRRARSARSSCASGCARR